MGVESEKWERKRTENISTFQDQLKEKEVTIKM